MALKRIAFFGFIFVGFLIFSNGYGQDDLTTLLEKLSATKKDTDKVPILKDIGQFYRKKSAFLKASEYYSQAYQIQKNTGVSGNELLNTLQNLAFTEKYADKNIEAYAHYAQIAQIQRQNADNQGLSQTLTHLSDLAIDVNNLPEAIKYAEEILQVRQNQQDRNGVLASYNNLGYLHKQAGDENKSMQMYDKLIALSRENQKNATPEDNALVLLNSGTAYTQKGDYQKARELYAQALRLAEKQNNPVRIAEIKNYLAANHYVSGNNGQALNVAFEAMETVKETDNQEVLATSYRVLSEIYGQDGDFKESQKYDRLYQQIKEKLAQEVQDEQAKLLDKQAELEQEENRIKEMLADKERQASKLREAELQREAKSKEVEVLKQQQARKEAELRTETLQRQQAVNLLQIAEQKAENERQKAEKQKAEAEAVSAKQVAKQQRLIAEKQKAETKQKQAALEAAEREKSLKDKQLEQEKSLRYYGLAVIIFGALFLLVIIYALYISQKQRKQLQAKNAEINQKQEEILSQNEELQQNQEEILAQRDFIDQQKNELQKSYDSISLISKIGRDITATLDLNIIIGLVYKQINDLMDATEFGIGTYSEETQTIDYVLYMYKGERMDDLQASISDDRLASWAIKNQKPVHIHDINKEYKKYLRSLDAYDNDELLKSVICLPLVAENRVVGILSVQSPDENAYSEYHMDIMQTLGAYVAIALDNYQAYSSLKNANQVIEEKNRSITGSIRYAKTIQTAILPPPYTMDKLFADSFVIYRPKDMVAGDFYWVNYVDNHTFAIVADCTGHGVPGAFMSMIGYSLFNQIINEKKIFQPAEILEMMHIKIKQALKQEETHNRDGMDVIVCAIEPKDKKFSVQFAGAKLPFYYTQNHEIQECKGSKKALGGIESRIKKAFKNHEFSFEAGTRLYLASDGYIDQNDAKREKLGKKQFYAVLQQVHTQPLATQKQKLEELLDTHQGTENQRDDITVMGIKL